MTREEFLKELEALAKAAGEENDEVVALSAVVLHGLLAAIYAGDGFFEAFVDSSAAVTMNQREVLIALTQQKDS